MRTGFTLMRKNIKKVAINKRQGSNQSTRGKSNNFMSDIIEDFFESSPKEREPKSNELSLPVIRRSSPLRARALSTGNIEQFSDIDSTQSANGNTAEVTPNVKERKEFTVRIIKEYNHNGTEKQRLLKEKEEQELREAEERRIATNILMQHGITASTSMQVSRKAAIEKNASAHSISNVNQMIESYQKELEGYRYRLLEMEKSEV